MTPPADSADTPALPDLARRMRSWLFDEALPFWQENALDRVHGGFHERLDLSGKPDLTTARRLRVQARQIYVFSQAHLMGWSGPALEIVEAGYEFLTHRGWLDEGGWLHLFTPQGGVFDDRRDTYDHAFVLFSLAWAHRALGRHDPLTWAERTLAFMDEELSDPVHGGFLEGLPPSTPRRQNPHMHYLEAVLALHAATGEQAYVDRARKTVDLFRQHFFDPRAGVLREYFADDFSALDDDVARMVEPGHHYEWVWRAPRNRTDDRGIRPS
ncbi:MAG: AGE family epimerase/isomerase, partial [Pseudomonadota bacterium]